MPLTDNTRGFLNDLKNSGVDATILAALERDLDSKDEGVKTVDRRILAQSTFSRYQSERDSREQQLKNQLTELSSLHDNKESFKDNPELYQKALDRIENLEKILIEEEGYDDQTIKNLSFQTKNELTDKLTDHLNQKKEQENKQVPNPNQNVDITKAIETAAANMGAFNVAVSAEISRGIVAAQREGIELSDEQLNGYAEALITRMEKGERPRDISNDYLGISAKQTENQTTARTAEIEKAKADAKAEAYKEMGINVRAQANRPKHHVFDRKPLVAKSAEGKNPNELLDEKGQPKAGHPLHFTSRNYDTATRRRVHSENAASKYNEVSQLYDEDGLYIGGHQNA